MTTIRTTTKREMIAGISMEHAIIQRTDKGRKWSTVRDPETGEPIKNEFGHLQYVETTPGEPTGDIAFCPEHSGMKALIQKSGRVTLDSFSSGPLGEFLDVTVMGDTFEEICEKGIKLLHERVMQSGLKD